MASGKSNYLANAILNAVLGGPAFTLPTTVYIALSTAAWSASATGSAMSEVNGGAYGRIAVTNNTTNFPSASGQSKSNGTVQTYAAATANWGTVLSFYIIDAASGGNCLYGGDLTASRTVSIGDTASFAQNALTFQEA